MIMMIFEVACLLAMRICKVIIFLGFFPTDAGEFTCLAGEWEKWCPGRRLPLNAGELEAL